MWMLLRYWCDGQTDRWADTFSALYSRILAYVVLNQAKPHTYKYVKMLLFSKVGNLLKLGDSCNSKTIS